MTGHKSVQSLTVYQRVNQQKKMEMGKVLTTAMQKKDNDLVKQVTHEPAVPMITATPQAMSPGKAIEAPPQKDNFVENFTDNNTILVPYEANFDEDIDDTDWLKLLCEVEEENNILPMPCTETAVQNTLMQRSSPMFANCKIGNININIQKK